MNRPFNFWDMLIGIGYGVTMTMLVLCFAHIIPTSVSIWGQVVFMLALALQLTRQIKQVGQNKVSESKNG